MKHTISHMGKSFTTIHYKPDADPALISDIRNSFYEKPDIEEVLRQFRSLYSGKSGINKIIDFYIKSLMYSATNKKMKWTVDEFLQSDDLIKFIIAKVESSPSFFPIKKGVKVYQSVLRVAPSGTAQKIPNFPYKEARKVIEKYNLNGNYYDYSCGWGVRTLASLSLNINYFGTDPNQALIDKIKAMALDYSFAADGMFFPDCSVRSHGSEIFVPEWENKMGLAFSSPPYFDLEIYTGDNQSISGRSYQMWLDSYWSKTVDNIIRYLIPDGYFLLNIKNFDKYKLAEDMPAIMREKGLVFVGTECLKNITRPAIAHKKKGADEDIFVFKKPI